MLRERQIYATYARSDWDFYVLAGQAFSLITQNRMARLADKRDHLDLQVNLMAEQEASMIIQMLDKISRKLGLPADGREDALALSRTATLENLLSQLHEQFPDTEGDLPDGVSPP